MCVCTELLSVRATGTMMNSFMQGPRDRSWVMSHSWHRRMFFTTSVIRACLGFPCFWWEEIVSVFHRAHKGIEPSKREKAATVETQLFMQLRMCVGKGNSNWHVSVSVGLLGYFPTKQYTFAEPRVCKSCSNKHFCISYIRSLHNTLPWHWGRLFHFIYAQILFVKTEKYKQHWILSVFLLLFFFAK